MGTDKIALGMSIGQLALLLKHTNDLAGSADHYHRCLEIFEQTDGPNRCVSMLKTECQANVHRPHAHSHRTDVMVCVYTALT